MTKKRGDVSTRQLVFLIVAFIAALVLGCWLAYLCFYNGWYTYTLPAGW
ncbi:hypothetical protein [Butyricicoccus sp. Marseille-Q5471]|nr:hypothetical protein [Butyricicoccus sp. Marseille-Q5471]